MKLSVPAGTTSKRIAIFIQDSSSLVGSGLTGLTNASANLVCYSWIDTDGNVGGTAQALQAATLGTWTTRGFIQKDATNLPGLYEFGVPDALLAVGVKWAVIMFKGATNMAPLVLEIEVTATSNQDATRGGLTALPNANAEAAGGLYTRGTGAGQIRQDANGRIDANAKAWIDGTIPAVNVTGVPLTDLKYTLGTISPAGAGAVRADSVTGAVGSVTAGVTVTTNNDKTGYALTTSERTSVADALLDRDLSTGTDSGTSSIRTVRQALRFLRNKWSIAGGTLHVTKEDDVTDSWTAAVTTSAGDPVSKIDPAGP